MSGPSPQKNQTNSLKKEQPWFANLNIQFIIIIIHCFDICTIKAHNFVTLNIKLSSLDPVPSENLPYLKDSHYKPLTKTEAYSLKYIANRRHWLPHEKYHLSRTCLSTSTMGYCWPVKIQEFNPDLRQRCPLRRFCLRYCQQTQFSDGRYLGSTALIIQHWHSSYDFGGQ